MSVSTGVFGDVAPEPGVAKPDPLLTVDRVRRDFGGLAAVDVEYLEVQRGVITALIGPNGAARRRSSTSSPASTGRGGDAGSSKVGRWPACRPSGWRDSGWCARSS